MNDKEYSQFLLTYVRHFFKNSLKSNNKYYSLHYGNKSLEKKMTRNSNAASHQLSTIREREGAENIDYLKKMSSHERAGNCGEYMVIALSKAVDDGRCSLWTISIESPYHRDINHELIVIGMKQTVFLPNRLLNMNHYDNANYGYIVDPWMNISCELHLYHIMMQIKVSQWLFDGKEIEVGNSHLQAPQWFEKIRNSNLDFTNMITDDGSLSEDYELLYR